MALQVFAYIIHKDGVADDTALELVAAAGKLDPDASITAVVAGAAVVLLVGAVETDVGFLADRGCEWTLDVDLEVSDGVHRFLVELGTVVLEPFETGV